MKFVSWNVNGLRACIGKGFLDYFMGTDADVFCLQETKLSDGQLSLELPVTACIGTMPTKRAIPVRQFL